MYCVEVHFYCRFNSNELARKIQKLTKLNYFLYKIVRKKLDGFTWLSYLQKVHVALKMFICSTFVGRRARKVDYERIYMLRSVLSTSVRRKTAGSLGFIMIYSNG